MKRTQGTSNELGNIMYNAVLREVIKHCTNIAQKTVAGFLLDRSPAVQIFNITDVLLSRGGISDSDDLREWISDVNNISVTTPQEGIAHINFGWTPYSDDLFVYAGTENELFYTSLIHRLSDEHAIMFFGMWAQDRFTVFESVTFEINGIAGIEANYTHMLDSVRDYIQRENIKDPRRREYLLASMDTCFLTFFTTVLRMFADLTNKDTRSYACYVDEAQGNKPVYYRAPLDKKVSKINDKPIILVMNSDKTTDERVKTYRRSGGKIHYAFSWVVRGHYRKLHNPKSLGLDRSGKRCVPGMTWIETYMKGDENLPLLKRERIVKEPLTV